MMLTKIYHITGPLTASINGRLFLVGVASWGYGCSNPAYPGVYSRVTPQMDWILANSDVKSWQCPNFSSNGKIFFKQIYNSSFF